MVMSRTLPNGTQGAAGSPAPAALVAYEWCVRAVGAAGVALRLDWQRTHDADRLFFPPPHVTVRFRGHELTPARDQVMPKLSPIHSA